MHFGAGMRGMLVAFCLGSLTRSISSFADGGGLGLAPDFIRADLTGRDLSLRSYRGKLVLLNFWATWCGPCLTEIPRFVTWQQAYGGAGFQMVGVSMDDHAAPVRRLYEKYHLNYPVVVGDADLGEQFGGVLGLPLSYLIAPDGHVLARYQGEMNLEKVETQIKSLLPRR